MTKSILSSIGLLAIAGGIGVAAYFFGGFLIVAADHADPALVNWAPVEVRKASIARRATAIVQAGAPAYATGGCAYCHGEPSLDSAKFSREPDPPADVRTVVTAR